MNSLLDAARARVAKKGPSCTIEILRVSNEDRLKDIDELLANTGSGREVPYTVAAALLSEEFNTKIPDGTLSRHVRGACACRS